MKKFLFALAAATALILAGCSRTDISLGVIGGADGPTAIFVSAAPYWWAPFAIIAAAIAAVAVIVRIRRNRKG